MLFAVHCPVCGRAGAAPCRPCVERLRAPPSGPAPDGADGLVVLTAYDDAGRALVHALKFRNHRDATRWTARTLATLVADVPGAVSWIPTTRARARARGYDQAEVLARALARAAHRPRIRTLRRRPGPHQTGRSAAERRTSGPRFDLRADRLPAALLLVDDVITTGATAAAATATLRAGGVRIVTIVTVARTPLKPLSVTADDGGDASHPLPGGVLDRSPQRAPRRIHPALRGGRGAR